MSMCTALPFIDRRSSVRMEDTQRFTDHRDSVMIRQADANRKGRTFSDNHSSLMSRDHVTPWGTSATGEPYAAPAPMSPTRKANHLQNEEAPAPQGDYTVPDPTPAHNHMQNSETMQGTDRLKMASSRINDAHIAFAPTSDLEGTTGVLQAANSDRIRLKVAPGTSRINDGHDIFGGPVEDSRVRKQRDEPFAERPRTGHIRTPWLGYTDASK